MSVETSIGSQSAQRQRSLATMRLRQPPECVRCRNHGRRITKKGHKKDCPLKNCMCVEKQCILLCQRQDVEKKIKDLDHTDRRQVDVKAKDRAVCESTDVSSKLSFMANHNFKKSYTGNGLKYKQVINNPEYNGYMSCRAVQQRLIASEPVAQHKDSADEASNGFTDHSIDSILSERPLRTVIVSQNSIHYRFEPIPRHSLEAHNLSHGSHSNGEHSLTLSQAQYLCQYVPLEINDCQLNFGSIQLTHSVSKQVPNQLLATDPSL